MPARVEIKGTAELRAVAVRLKAAGNKQLTRRMSRRMREAAKPAVRDAQQSVQSLNTRSSRGGGGQARRAYTVSRARKKTDRVHAKAFAGRGLRATVARAVRTQVSAGARSASVRIRTQTRYLPPDQRKLPRHMNTGRWRHPVFGNREHWVTQQTTPSGWFDRPMQRHGPHIRNDAVSVVDEIAREIAR